MMMKKKNFSLLLYEKFLVFSIKDLVRFFLLLLVICQQNLSAQTNGDVNLSKPIITLSGNVKIISSDENFNVNIKEKSIVLKSKSRIKIKNVVDDQIVIIAESKNNSNQSFASQVKIAQKNRENEKIAEIQKVVKQIKTTSESHYRATPSSEHHILTTNINGNKGFVPVLVFYKFSKDSLVHRYTSLKQRFYYLYPKKYFSYNYNVIEDFISKVFSARPPPIS